MMGLLSVLGYGMGIVCWISQTKKWDAALLRVHAVQRCFVIKQSK